ncbi:MAG: acyltransferase family protein [Clostridia bacterium]|nr:acyltransferase family protein [Clostridia bacterium]
MGLIDFKKKKYHCIDLFKLLMAILVIIMHTEPFKYLSINATLSTFLSGFLSIAVPFFFLSSSFFLFAKFDDDFLSNGNFQILKRYLVRLVKLYIIWQLIYLPIEICAHINNGLSFWEKVFRYAMMLLFNGGGSFSLPLWYLLGSIFCAGIIYLAMKLKAKEWTILLICIMLYIISKSMSYLVYNGESFGGILFSLRNLIVITFQHGRVLGGFLYFGVGLICARKINKILSPLFNVFIFIALYLASCLLSKYTALTGIITSLYAIIIFLFALGIQLNDNSLYKFVRKQSTVIYFIHMIFLFFYVIIFGSRYGLLAFTWVICLSVLFSIIIVKYINKSKVLTFLFG